MTTPYLTRYRNGEYLQYIKDVLDLVNKQDVDVLELTQQRNELTTNVNTIDATYQQSLGSALTQEIIDLDTRRDNAMIGIRAVASGFLYHYNTATKKQAQDIINTISIYGSDITRKNYQEETAVLNSLIKDLETKEEVTVAIAALSLNDWLAELKAANEAFTGKYLERVEETAANPSTSIIELRALTSIAYKNLISHIEAHNVLSNTVAYNTMLVEIEVLTKQYNLVVDNRTASNTTDNSTTDTSANL